MVRVESMRRRRLEPDARREQILSVAIRHFGSRPYAEVSTTDVARDAGVARGLVNHYFGTKKDLYLAVVRVMLTVPEVALEQLPEGDLPDRVDSIVGYFLDVVSRHSTSWLAATGAGGMAGDADVNQVIAEAVDVAAVGVLRAVGMGDDPSPVLRAMCRSYVGLAICTAQEWLQRGVLTRQQVHALLATSLIALVEQVFPVH
ncbi:AcrR family transcriptional regulator [Actinoplanes campanulatus]|uniref:AcrR family transcriptional regulator n=1 Tax=Actinoplanes campanulatus TaxID=113559 RepID=A0A7W5AIF1_9ACTN|nr:TetR/AcrR family transcriptional regulator [Actinoplanes campanulatus]MBB3096682.1 AcrR family transcriptional regulator [Actinoplanes campanulatus]GGN30620.1 TetR family transcriptional regulator [Actinoplanes campanulatus]GID37225.1 TetR family transcriptional regulator [Actinoplanes campanulatus]